MNDLTTEENAPERPSAPDGSRQQFRPLRAWPAFLLAFLMLAARFGPAIPEGGAAKYWMVAVFGPLLGCLRWYDEDVSRISILLALRHQHQHAVIIKERLAGGREYVVQDTMYDRELRYRVEELLIQELIVWTLEPSGPDAAARLERFLSEKTK